jgi:hypothetical protein
MHARPRNLSDFVEGLQASGRYTFRREEAVSGFEVSEIALRNAVRRPAAKARICAPRRGFCVIVPLEYSQSGAAHQQPRVFQVVTGTTLRLITAGRTRIRFFQKWYLAETVEVRNPPPTRLRCARLSVTIDNDADYD